MTGTGGQRFLVDTHTLLFLRMDDPALSVRARGVLLAAESSVYLSVASIWEMAIKSSLGKLFVEGGLSNFVTSSFSEGGLELLAVGVNHVLGVEALPFHHRDPFDRLLASQALAEGLTVVSRDSVFDRYGVPRIW